MTWGDSRCATADALSRCLACSAYIAVQSNGREFDRRSFPHHSGSSQQTPPARENHVFLDMNRSDACLRINLTLFL
jgi:hypothetical protein